MVSFYFENNHLILSLLVEYWVNDQIPRGMENNWSARSKYLTEPGAFMPLRFSRVYARELKNRIQEVWESEPESLYIVMEHCLEKEKKT